jgi:hypothetical protein
MRPRHRIGVVSASILALVLTAVLVAQAPKPYGATTPQAAVATLKSAMTANDYAAVFPVVAPDALKGLASEGVTGLLMVLAFSDPDDAMPGAPKPSKAELDAKRRSYKDARDLAAATLKPYGLDTLIGKPVLATATQDALEAGLAKADPVVLMTSLLGALDKIGPMLGMKKDAKPEPIVPLGNVTGYKIAGDTATAQNGAETIDFRRIDGRWYLIPPSKAGATASGAPASAQSGAAKAPATSTVRATASGNQPEIVVGGLQIAKVIVADDDYSAKPFHSNNGTRLALWIKMPASQGLIEIDEDASVLAHFGDDKGGDLGGEFESFPDEFKDGSGGVIEVESSGVPVAGATSLVAEGSIAMTIATGTRKTRVANVRIQNDQKFSLGSTRVNIAEVETSDEDQTFTLQLPRQVMVGIRNVAFFDAKGQPVEGSRTSTGYMNDAGEMGLRVKTTAKTITLEFEVWQGQRTVKVPFSVKTGLSLN